MTSSAGGKGPRMPARSVGGLQPADGPVDLLLGGGPVPLSDGAGLPEEEAGLLGEGKASPLVHQTGAFEAQWVGFLNSCFSLLRKSSLEQDVCFFLFCFVLFCF